MSDAATVANSQDIVVDEVFPHAPEVVWKTLSTPELMGRWLSMTSVGFEATRGRRFTYQTTPAGEWDGVIRCEVLEVIVNERLVYTRKGGHEANVGYGSRLEIVHAARRLAEEVAAGRLSPETIDEDALSARLYTADIPDPDLIIRTSGEKRISNFLLWQAAYAELVFVDTLWPDFTKRDLEAAIEEFHRRERRFGATTAGSR